MKQYQCHLFTAQSGALTAKLEDENGCTIHIHSLVKPELESQYFDDLNLWGDRIILLGTGLGYHLQKLKEKITSNCKIIVIEFYEELAEICVKEIFDRETRIITSASPNPVSMLREFIDGGKLIQIIKHPVAYRVQREFYDAIIHGAQFSKNSKKSGSALLLYGNFFVQEELRRAIENSQMKAEIFDYRKSESFTNYQSDFEQALQKSNCETILSINMKGLDGNGIWSDLASEYGVQVCVWFVDDPAPILLHQQQYIKSDMIAFCWEKAYLEKLKRAGFGKVYHLPLAASLELFSKRPVDLKTEVAFVGSSMSCEFLNQIRKKFLWNPSLEPLINNCAEMLLEDNNRDPFEILSQMCKRDSVNLPFSDIRNLTWLRSLFIHTASMMKRKKIIQSLLQFGVETFGDPNGWKNLFGDTLKTNSDIDYRTELAEIYRSIKININITSCQMPSAVNQRVFDIPACGSFVINDRQGDLNELFESNEIVTFSSTEDLQEKVRYYSCHEAERIRVIELAYKRILNEHTYINRCKSIRCLAKS